MSVRKKEFGPPRIFSRPGAPGKVELFDARDFAELDRLRRGGLQEVDREWVANCLSSVARDDLPLLTVVNLHYQVCDIRVDRSGPYGNPHLIGREYDRRGAIKAFSESVDATKLNTLLEEVLLMRLNTTIVRLGCWCKPALCHGDVWVQRLEKLHASLRK